VTDEQAQAIRSEVSALLARLFGKPLAIVIVTQDEAGLVEVVTNAKNVNLVPSLLETAAEISRASPDGTTRRH